MYLWAKLYTRVYVCRHGPVELCEVTSGPRSAHHVTIEELIIAHGDNTSVQFYNCNIKHNYSEYIIIIHTPITACPLSIVIV